MLLSGSRPVEYWHVSWSTEEAARFGGKIGDPRLQSAWEYFTLLLCLLVWGDSFRHEAVAILGDNLGALSSAVSLKGTGPMLQISRELSWRRARNQWAYEVGHLPAEANTIADALSRLHAPAALPMPSCPAECRLWEVPDRSAIWRV